MNFGFINLEIKKNVPEKMFQNDFLSSEFSILKIFFVYGTTISKTPKTVKDNFGILKNAGV